MRSDRLERLLRFNFETRLNTRLNLHSSSLYWSQFGEVSDVFVIVRQKMVERLKYEENRAIHIPSWRNLKLAI